MTLSKYIAPFKLTTQIYLLLNMCNLLSLFISSRISYSSEPLWDIEIRQVRHSFKPFKVLRPDGLHPMFYQNYWNEVCPSVTSLCHQVFREHAIPLDINQTYLCFIPKVTNNSSNAQYHPISLCNTIYKIITKIILNCSKPFIFKIISPTQSSFQKGKRASDNAIIAQEILHHFTKMYGNQSVVMLKLDLQKVFDRLEWSFIYQTVHFFKFSKHLPSN